MRNWSGVPLGAKIPDPKASSRTATKLLKCSRNPRCLKPLDLPLASLMKVAALNTRVRKMCCGHEPRARKNQKKLKKKRKNKARETGRIEK